MKSPGRKKKVEKESPVETKDQNVVEPPKNLLPEKSESEQAEKAVSEQSGIASTVEPKTNEIKSEEVIPASSSPPPSSPPPISVPISQVEPLSSTDKPANKSFLWIIVVIIAILLVVAGGWFYLSSKSKIEEKKTGKETSIKPTTVKAQPTATATEEAKLDKYPIKVLNGSGIVGEASNLQAILEKEGFEVSETDNAENYDYTDTIVQAKKSVEKAFLEKLKTLIGKSYTLGKDEELSASESS